MQCTSSKAIISKLLKATATTALSQQLSTTMAMVVTWSQRWRLVSITRNRQGISQKLGVQEEVTQILNILPLSLNITVVEATEILRPILTLGIGLLIFFEYLMVLFLVLELGSSMEGLHLEEEEQVVVVAIVVGVAMEVEKRQEHPMTTEGSSLKNNTGCLLR